MNSHVDSQGAAPGALTPFPNLRTIIEHWRHTGAPDAVGYLQDHPELGNDVAAVRELAYEEFCLRREAGELLDPAAFCARFVPYAEEVRRTLEVDAALTAEDNAAAFFPGWPQVGDVLQGSVLVKELGKGGFGTVFLARQPRAGNRLVVLKVSEDGAAEAKLLGRLPHPNIVPLYDTQRDGCTGLQVVCMPYLGLVTLHDLVRRLFAQGSRPTTAHAVLEAAQVPSEFPVGNTEPPPAVYRRGTYHDAVVYLGMQLAEGLACAHAKQIAHRDIKPANLLVTPSGHLRILDFNLASSHEETEDRLAGTLSYMAPEQLQTLCGEKPQEVSPVKADLYALGVILYELAAGRHPFDFPQVGMAEAELCQRLLNQQRLGFVPLRRWCRSVPTPLARLIERCLAWNPAERPASAAEVARLLEKMLACRTQRQRLLRTVAAAAAGALLTCGGFWTAGTSWSSPVTPPARLDGNSYLRKGLDAYREKDYPAAVRYLTAARLHTIDKHQQAWLLYTRGRAYQQVAEHAAARTDFLEAFALVPDWRIRVSLGYCHNALGAHRKALEDYSWVIEHQPTCAAAYNNRGFSYLSLGDPAWLEPCEADLIEALRLNPQLGAARANLVRLAIHQMVRDRGRKPTFTREQAEEALPYAVESSTFAFDLTWLAAESARRSALTADWAAWIDLGVRCAEVTLRTGLPADRLHEQTLFSQLALSPRFHELLHRYRHHAAGPVSALTPRYLDPLGPNDDTLMPK